jgi:ketopantoate hydroxymethyltransferase
MKLAIQDYVEEVRGGTFPGMDHSYSAGNEKKSDE